MGHHHPLIVCPPAVEETRLTTLALATDKRDQIADEIAHAEALDATHVYTTPDGYIPKEDWLVGARESLAFWNKRIDKQEAAGP